VSVHYSKHTTSLVEVAGGRGPVPTFSPLDALTYEPYFTLREKPFGLNADARFIYDSPTHGAARKGLLAAIRRREGLVVLTGEIGTGKTTLCRSVLRDLGRSTYCSLVADPFATREDLLKMLLVDFGVVSIQELASGGLRQASRTELGFMLSEFLDSLEPDAFAVVIIDEAQNLTLPLIEETRILFDTYAAKGRMQIVFSGQPELHAKLKLPEMRQVDQRVCGYYRLAPMTRDAVMGYVQHRLHAAGGRRDRVLFPPAVIDALHKRSGGVPRLINRICDRALQLAFERGSEAVTADILDGALIELGAVTLSPTWDAIVFAEPPAAVLAPAAAPVPPVVQAPDAAPAPPAPAAPAAAEPIAQASHDQEDFEKEIDNWVSKDLAAPSRTLTPLPAPADTPAAPRRQAPSAPAVRAQQRPVPQRAVRREWPDHVRSETYVHKFMRLWATRAALAAGALVAINLLIAGATTVLAGLAPASPSPVPDEPAATVMAAPAAVGFSSAADAPMEEPPAVAPAAQPDQLTVLDAAPAAAVSEDFLVAVGLFADRSRADQLVDTLTEAGLPAMQRPFQMRRGEVQQVVLGPFFSRDDAMADLQKLKALGGYADASIVAQ
jgi:type II secretory pathway predicted ATPase ExeA